MPKVSQTTRPSGTRKLRFTGYTWSLLQLLYSHSRERNIEMSFIGVADPEDPLIIVDLLVPKQKCGSATTDFDDLGYAEAIAEACEIGYEPSQLWHWIHFHPFASSRPSGTDESTFRDVFGNFAKASMIIIAEDSEVSCRVQYDSTLGRQANEISVEALYPNEQDLLDLAEELPSYAKLLDERIEESVSYGLGFPGTTYTGTGLRENSTAVTFRGSAHLFEENPAGQYDRYDGKVVTSQHYLYTSGKKFLKLKTVDGKYYEIPWDDDDQSIGLAKNLIDSTDVKTEDVDNESLLRECIIEANEDPDALDKLAKAIWNAYDLGQASDEDIEIMSQSYDAASALAKNWIDWIILDESNNTYDDAGQLLNLMERGQFNGSSLDDGSLLPTETSEQEEPCLSN